MTGKASDPPDWQQHIGNKARREALAKRFRDPADPLRVVLVRDMWLTGFDAPSLHTMYVDKPMRGHGVDAGHRTGQPGVPGQAGRAGRGLSGPRPRAEACAGDLHGERRPGGGRTSCRRARFAEMLEQTIRRYQNRTVEAAQVIEELIGLAREMREANARGDRLGLSDEELAFYDALGVNDSAVQVLGDETLPASWSRSCGAT